MEALVRHNGITHPQQVVTAYLERLPGEELENATAMASELIEQGGPLAKTVVIVPVAAHQESAWIKPALSQYARQRTDTPFTVVLGLNCPAAEADDTAVQQCIAATDQAKADHPELDVRTTFRTYEQPVIGKIRRDLWNGVARASLHDKTSMEMGGDTIGINHDIDLIRLDMNVIRNIQRHYQRYLQDTEGKFMLEASNTQVRHGISPDHPNISRTVTWSDYVSRACEGHFEEGFVIPLAKYARGQGFNPRHKLREVLSLMGGMRPGIIRNTATVTSPRRYLQYMNTHGYEIWEEDIFSATDACRIREDFPDIDRGRMEEIVTGRLSTEATAMIRTITNKVAYYMNRLEIHDPELFKRLVADNGFFMEQVRARTDRRRLISSRILAKTVGIPAVTQEFENRFSAEKVEDAANTHYTVLAETKGIKPKIVT